MASGFCRDRLRPGLALARAEGLGAGGFAAALPGAGALADSLRMRESSSIWSSKSRAISFSGSMMKTRRISASAWSYSPFFTYSWACWKYWFLSHSWAAARSARPARRSAASGRGADGIGGSGRALQRALDNSRDRFEDVGSLVVAELARQAQLGELFDLPLEGEHVYVLREDPLRVPDRGERALKVPGLGSLPRRCQEAGKPFSGWLVGMLSHGGLRSGRRSERLLCLPVEEVKLGRVDQQRVRAADLRRTVRGEARHVLRAVPVVK